MLKIILTFGSVLIFCAAAFAQTAESNKKILFKAETEFSAQLENQLDAENAKIGEDANFKLTEDVRGEGDTIAKDSVLYGRIVNVEKASDANKKTSLISVMFDFVKKDEEFVPLTASIISAEKAPAGMKFAPSPTFAGGTVISTKGKNLMIDKGTVFRIKLVKDITEN